MDNMFITLAEVLFYSNILNRFGCCKLIINDEVVWDDDVDWNRYVKFEDAINRYTLSNPNCTSYKVTDINIQIVHMHHSIISIRCESEM